MLQIASLNRIAKEILAQVGATLKATGYPRKAPEGSEFAYVIDVLEFEVLVPAEQPPPKANAMPLKKG